MAVGAARRMEGSFARDPNEADGSHAQAIPVGATVAPLTLTQVIVVRIHDREQRRPYRLEA